MKKINIVEKQAFGLALLGLLSITGKAQTKHEKTNIIYILADDLGYNELGCYGQKKIKTPNIDRLASEGMVFTNHYSGSAVSAPSRCSLLSGMHQGHAFIRGNSEVGEWYDYEGQMPLADSIYTLAELMKEAGYTTGAIGKWGLGNTGEGHPNNQGFDYFYGYLCQRQAHNYYPDYLWENNKIEPQGNTFFKPHQKLTQGPDNADNYKQFLGKDYAPEMMTKKTLEFIAKNKDNNFFLFLPTPIPHVSLQIPDSIRLSFGYNFEETPYNSETNYTPNFTPRSSYAAMISYLDSYVGKIMNILKQYGLEENTIIMFSSDNGTTYAGGVDYMFFESLGTLRGYKGQLYEGGIKVPFIVRWPGHIPKGSISNHISAFWDVLPTLSDIVSPEKEKNYDGISFLPELLNKPQTNHEYLYWEFHERDKGIQAVRMGPWKGLRKNAQVNPGSPVELYHLGNDPEEKNNVAGQFPEIVEKMREIFRTEHVPSAFNFWRMAE